jgi:hypothetical protein
LLLHLVGLDAGEESPSISFVMDGFIRVFSEDVWDLE